MDRSLTKGYSSTHIGADYTDDERRFLFYVDRWRCKHRSAFITYLDILAIASVAGFRRAERPGRPPSRHAIEEHFRQALDDYKRQQRRPHPTIREVLAVLRS